MKNVEMAEKLAGLTAVFDVCDVAIGRLNALGSDYANVHRITDIIREVRDSYAENVLLEEGVNG